MNVVRTTRRAGQRGATLVVALIMLALITLLVINAFLLSSSNLKAVGNMQAREESIAAANQAIEQAISSPNFYSAAGNTVWNVDINHDGTADYQVTTLKPVCIRAAQSGAAYPSDVELGAAMSAGSTWNVDWDIAATVTDAATGASVKLHQGVRTLLPQTTKETVCP